VNIDNAIVMSNIVAEKRSTFIWLSLRSVGIECGVKVSVGDSHNRDNVNDN